MKKYIKKTIWTKIVKRREQAAFPEGCKTEGLSQNRIFMGFSDILTGFSEIF